MWKPGDLVVWRGIYRNRVWHAQTTFVVKDSPEEIVLALLPGAEGMADSDYAKGEKNGKRRWDFKDRQWELEKFRWLTNRLLFLLESKKYYSIIYFWNDDSNESIFSCRSNEVIVELIRWIWIST